MSRAFLEINRRRFLGGAVTAATFAIATRAVPNALAAPLASLADLKLQRRFAPVKVARNRVIREVVGLRPYRAPGFMVGAERIGRKLLVHNYGHGGAGVTLSWGTASLALDLARDFIQGTDSRAGTIAAAQTGTIAAARAGTTAAANAPGNTRSSNSQRPVRGQLEVLLPQPEIDYCYLSGRGYMFPRRDGIILGGTWDHENWSLEPNPEQTNQILTGHSEIMQGLRQ